MASTSNTEIRPYNLQIHERVIRIIIGTGFILSVLFLSAPVNLMIILPLIGIYPCLTGIVGWDPLYHLAGLNAQLSIKQLSSDQGSANPVFDKAGKLSYLPPRYA